MERTSFLPRSESDPMSTGQLNLDDALYHYLLSVSLRETPVQRALRQETDRLAEANMRTAADQTQLLALLVKLSGARRILEIGTFTGYGTLAMALALPEDGRIVACDVSEKWTAIARTHWAQAGVAGRIELRLAPALETLEQLIAAGGGGRFDFATSTPTRPICRILRTLSDAGTQRRRDRHRQCAVERSRHR